MIRLDWQKILLNSVVAKFMKPVALVTTKPGFEPQLREELNKLPIKKKILWTPFRGILEVLSQNPYEFLNIIKENRPI